MVTLDPVALAFATPASVSLAAVQSPSQVKLDNESNFALTVQIGQNKHWLPAWTSDVYAVGDGAVLAISPLLLTSSVSTPSSLLLVTVAQGGESFPGNFPAALVRQTASFALDDLLGSFTLPGGAARSAVFTVDQDVRALLVMYAGPAGKVLSSLNVVGRTSGAEYFGQLTGWQGGAQAAVISPAIDTSYTITANALNAGTVYVAATRSTEAVLTAISGQPIAVTGSGTFDISDRTARVLGQVSSAPGATFDVSDRAARLLGTISPVAGSTFDVSDRAARLLGTISPVAGSTFDVSDRAARELGRTAPHGYDAQATAEPALGVQASVTLAAPGVGLRYYLRAVLACMREAVSGTAVVQAANLEMRDTSSAGTLIASLGSAGTPATLGQSAPPIEASGLAIKQDLANTALWVGWSSAPGSNGFETLFAGADIAA